MPKLVRVPGVGVVKFPDTTPPQVMAGALSQLKIPNTHGAAAQPYVAQPKPAEPFAGQSIQDILSQIGDLGNRAMKMFGLEPFGPQDPSAYKTVDTTGTGPFGATPDARFKTELPQRIGVILHHGSPHLFDAFDTAKIGTGEGAQAYGHGLYFAENPEVAKTYAEDLGGADSMMRFSEDRRVLGQAFYDNASLPSGNIAHKGRMYSKDEFLDAFENEKISPFDFGPKTRTAVENKFAGKVYTVDVPNAHTELMLDWDKPLGKQPQAVQAAARKAFGEIQTVKRPDGTYGMTGIQPDGTGHVIGGIIANTPEEARTEFEKFMADEPASQFYYRLGTPKEASAKLNAAGIPGIKYLDEGSRAKTITDKALDSFLEASGGNHEAAIDEYLKRVHVSPKEKATMRANMIANYKPKTRNFVIFDPSIINSVKRNGQTVYTKAGVFSAPE